jgi:hypothetical protein
MAPGSLMIGVLAGLFSICPAGHRTGADHSCYHIITA